MVSDPILLFLIVTSVALLTLGTLTTRLPGTSGSFLTTMFCGLGALLCLPPLITRAETVVLTLPLGPPGLSLHFALDPLSLAFLILTFLIGTAIAAFQAAGTQVPRSDGIRTTAFSIGGTALALLAADGMVLTLGLATISASICPRAIAAPFMILAAVCLLTPPGYPPRFDAIRTAPADPLRAAATLILTVTAIATMLWPRSIKHSWTTDTLTAGLAVPLGSYLLLRLTADLSATAIQPWCGFIPLLGGCIVAAVQAWRAAAAPDIDTAANALIGRQSGLSTASIGLFLIARAADLPAAASFALNATFLAIIGSALAGTLTVLAAHAIGAGAGTFRLARLGGLIHLMPGTSAALSAGLLALSALPPGLGFFGMWLSFQSILSAPRTGGLISQLPLALLAASLALTAALATTASIRIAGIAILGRPRTPRGAGARETASTVRSILLTLAGASILAGILPNQILWLLAEPAAHDLLGTALPSAPAGSPGYTVLVIIALAALTTTGAMVLPKRARREAKIAGPWLDGFPPEIGLPFGEPSAQSAGAGFLPDLPRPRIPTRVRLPNLPPLPKISGPWLILIAFAVLLLAIGVSG